jgi:hypothetical protein
MALTWHFCPDCGTRLYKEGDAPAFEGIAIVQAGTIDVDGEKERVSGVGVMEPDAELWTTKRVGWLRGLEGKAQMKEFE